MRTATTDSLTGIPEHALIAGMRDGDHAIMAALFRSYFAPLVKFVRRYVDSIDAAEELVADVFARLWERRTSWAPQNTVESYLFASVRNAALNWRRSAEREGRRLELLAIAEELDEEDTESSTVDESVPLSAHIDAALWQLSERNRTIIELRWQRQLSFAEIAEILGTTAGAVQRQHSRVLATLRELMVKIG